MALPKRRKQTTSSQTGESSFAEQRDAAFGLFVSTDEIILRGSSGMGSTGTATRRFTTVAKNVNVSNSLTYFPDAVNGDSVVVNKLGLYAIVYCDIHSGLADIGISINAPSPVTTLLSLTDDQILAAFTLPGANQRNSYTWVGVLGAGSVLRATTNGASIAVGSDKSVKFQVVRLR